MNEKKIVIVKNDNTKKCHKQKLFIKECQNQTLMQMLQKNNIFVSNSCNGNGTCGKCKIRVISGNLPITEADRRCLSNEELGQRIRLACKAKIEELFERNDNDRYVFEVIAECEEDIVVESVDRNGNKYNSSGDSEKKEIIQDKNTQETLTNSEYFIAVDLGTTTIAMALADVVTGEIQNTYISLNHQRKYGADVITRITAANSGKAEELKRVIEQDLWQGICKLVKTFQKISPKSKTELNEESEQNKIEQIETTISRIIISGNTTMIHLLMGYSCETLGKYPFVSEYLGLIKCNLNDCFTIWKQKTDIVTRHIPPDAKVLFEKSKNIPVTILPAISAFVGGDVAADLMVCSGFETEEICLLIDLGTNGEMVLGNKNRLLATSTAAGPAFEGGNIVCGTASVPGSISRIKIQNQRAVVKTIQNKMPPVGVCGTGVISAISQLRQKNILDEQGVLRYPYQERGYPLWSFEDGSKIAIYQQDIREFQMAKSAIRAGIEILMEMYGCNVDEISHVYLAGGFGVNLSEEDAVCTGILPGEFNGKIETLGNGALKGAIQYGMKKRMDYKEVRYKNESEWKQSDKKIEEMIKRTTSISLAETQSFQEKYLKFINFDILQ